MRISDWSSDVCSSDLRYRRPRVKVNPHPEGREAPVGRSARAAVAGVTPQPPSAMVIAVGGAAQGLQQRQHLDRKSVVSGKRVQDSVDIGGRQIITNKKQEYTSKSSLINNI